jgi:anti-sigma regulatory factor (Ser/Thr protein kinase)
MYRDALGIHTTGKSLIAPGQHAALFYRNWDDYFGEIVSFVRSGLDEAEPVLVALPLPRAQLIHNIFETSRQVTFVDMMELGANPARIIPALRRFIYNHGERPTRFVGEPAWPGRSSAELAEVILHDSLVDLSKAGTETSVLCAYNSTTLDLGVLAAAGSLHTHVIDSSGSHPSPHYDPHQARALFARPFPDPPNDAHALRFDHDLAHVRRFVEHHVASSGLDSACIQDLLLAVSEVATNTIVHAGSAGLLRLWQDDASEVVCEVCDSGHVSDVLAGRLGPYPLALHGWGLWMVNQVCDLVELRSGDWGTAVRLHMHRRPPVTDVTGTRTGGLG